jgi:hypothetical protein
MHAQVTRHPVARGQALTDNVRPDPDSLTLECFFSNRPADVIEMVKRYATGNFTHAEDSLAQLEEAFRNAWRATIKMRLKTYENMVIEDIGVPETVEDGASVRATVQFTEIRTAVAQTFQQVQTKTTGQGAKKLAGVKPKKTPTEPLRQSAAARAADNTGFSNNSTLFKR